jgi:methylated-DNA-[protein]-cysteine S-methyltransferase
VHPTGIGPVTMEADRDGLTHLFLPGFVPEAGATGGFVPEAGAPGDGDPAAAAHLAEAARQLDEYFAGTRRVFDLALRPTGTEFQRTVWRALCEIPFGETISYAELARRVGRPEGFRAVGQANARNPLAIVVPCHRVIAAGGGLGGYSGGLDVKARLLALESAGWSTAGT